MAVTYTKALQRDTRRRIHVVPVAIDNLYLVLLSTSLVAMLAVALAYEGRVRRPAAPGGPSPDAVVNLSTVTNAATLEPMLAAALEAPADRRFAAQELLSFINAARERREELPNAAAILRVTVPASRIERTPGLTTYAERLQRAREAQVKRGAAGPEQLSLFTNADLVLLKPGLSVRTAGQYRGLLLRWGARFIAHHRRTIG
jgi:hypothetical protein